MKNQKQYIMIFIAIIILIVAYFYRMEIVAFFSKKPELKKSSETKKVVEHLETEEGQKILEEEDQGLKTYGLIACENCV